MTKQDALCALPLALIAAAIGFTAQDATAAPATPPALSPATASASAALETIADRRGRGIVTRYARDDVEVDAPTTHVRSKHGHVEVNAPYAHVERSRDGVRVRAPFVDIWIPRR